MRSLLAKWMGTALAVFVAAQIIPGITVGNFYIALLVALVLGLVNIFVKPLLSLLTLPITILTFGIFSLVLNALLFWLVAGLVSGFSINGFLPALVGSLFVSAISFLLNKILIGGSEQY